jgi:selenocysteine lyase/cysteine desulfurase
LGCAIENILKVGVDKIRAEAFHLAEFLRTEIKKLNFKVFSYSEQPNQFVNFSSPKGNKELQNYLQEQGVNVPLRGPGVRVTPHAFNSEDDIKAFVEILKKF